MGGEDGSIATAGRSKDEPPVTPESPMPDTDARYNRDDDQKPGAPPRSATEPAGAKGSARSDKTRTDPATGEPKKSPPKPNRAD
jgi:hypothetical protein